MSLVFGSIHPSVKAGFDASSHQLENDITQSPRRAEKKGISYLDWAVVFFFNRCEIKLIQGRNILGI